MSFIGKKIRYSTDNKEEAKVKSESKATPTIVVPTKKYVQKYVKRKFDKWTEDKAIYLQNSVAVGNIIDYIPLNANANGAGVADRVGNRIKNKYLSYRLAFNNTGAPGITWIRILVILDKQPNGALPSNVQLLYNVTANQSFKSGFNVNGMERYKILYDKLLPLDVLGGATDFPQPKVLQGRINLRNVITVFNGAAAGIASINTNAIHFAWMTQATANMSYDTVLYFEDS